jgi:HCOMODA/2-hydroxy-3-carboxy-muconic semialdehyde decarboxylase
MVEQQTVVKKAARALAKCSLVGPYGHCLIRLNASELLVCAAKPVGTIAIGEDGTTVPIHRPLPEGVLREVSVSAADLLTPFRCRGCMPCSAAERDDDVGARASTRNSTRIQSIFPSTTGVLVVDCLRSDEIAAGVAAAPELQGGSIPRANGAVVASVDIKQAVKLAWFLEDMCRIELGILATGEGNKSPLLTFEETSGRSEWRGRAAKRMRDYLTAGDRVKNTERQKRRARLDRKQRRGCVRAL